MPPPFEASILNLDLPRSAYSIVFSICAQLWSTISNTLCADGSSSLSSNGKEGCESEMRISRPPF